MEATVYQKLRDISDAVGSPFQLRPNQELVQYSISENLILVALTVRKTRETISRTSVIAEGTRMLSWKRESPMHYWVKTDMTSWDEEFTPYDLHQVGRIETPAEYTERRAWEGMQYRVGSDRNPMDNAHRSADPTYSPMHNYWMKG